MVVTNASGFTQVIEEGTEVGTVVSVEVVEPLEQNIKQTLQAQLPESQPQE